jgi:hypothetical protein
MDESHLIGGDKGVSISVTFSMFACFAGIFDMYLRCDVIGI